MPMAVVNGTRIHYLRLGEQARPGDQGVDDREELVMVHGLATSLAFWYLNYACELASEFRITLFDLRGHGRSQMTATGYSPENLARDMAGLLDHLGIAEAHVMAHSFGGVVAMNFALRESARVRSLVLADTHIEAARRTRDAGQWSHRSSIQAVLDRLGSELDTRDPYFGYKLLTSVAQMQLEGAIVPEELLEAVKPLTGRAGGQVAAQWLRLMRSTSAGEELMAGDGLAIEALRTFTFPILAIYGERSPARLTGTELLEVWPQAEFRNVRNAGHFFPMTRAEEVLSSCRRFWRGNLDDSGQRRRAGEEQRSYFRSDRFFRDAAGWYFSMRERGHVGPFERPEEARAAFLTLIEQL
jgi:pimeloyl-ACP methyl ester carboxylesterase